MLTARLITCMDWCEGGPQGYSVDIATMRRGDCRFAKENACTHERKGEIDGIGSRRINR
jgi:hypothetical protein